jgi:ADP-ribosylglycohydrolase
MHDSLDGLSVGDAFGQQFMWHAEDIPSRRVDVPIWRWTDDTEMALSIVRVLLKHGEINQDHLAKSFADEFDSARGYGAGMLYELLPRLKAGHSWRDVSPALFGGGSYGNGGAMRVGPLGAYFADDIHRAAEQARMSAEITHAHEEGIAGAIAVAVAAAISLRINRDMDGRQFLATVATHVPEGLVRQGILKAIRLDEQTDADLAGVTLGNGARVTAQDTVPFCLWIVSRYPDNFEEALWQTVGALGDMDTTCAIVGGILGARLGRDSIPTEWLAAREPLPAWHLSDGHRYVR